MPSHVVEHKAVAGISLALALPLMLIMSNAHAEFKCNAPSDQFDVRACEAAKESPHALRLYVQRLKPISNLYFFDYVNEERVRAWEQSESRGKPMRAQPTQTAERGADQPGS